MICQECKNKNHEECIDCLRDFGYRSCECQHRTRAEYVIIDEEYYSKNNSSND